MREALSCGGFGSRPGLHRPCRDRPCRARGRQKPPLFTGRRARRGRGAVWTLADEEEERSAVRRRRDLGPGRDLVDPLRESRELGTRRGRPRRLARGLGDARLGSFGNAEAAVRRRGRRAAPIHFRRRRRGHGRLDLRVCSPRRGARSGALQGRSGEAERWPRLELRARLRRHGPPRRQPRAGAGLQRWPLGSRGLHHGYALGRQASPPWLQGALQQPGRAAPDLLHPVRRRAAVGRLVRLAGWDGLAGLARLPLGEDVIRPGEEAASDGAYDAPRPWVRRRHPDYPRETDS